MSTRLVLAALTGAVLAGFALSASAGPVPPACVVVNADPVHAQVGYAPNGPADCTPLP